MKLDDTVMVQFFGGAYRIIPPADHGSGRGKGTFKEEKKVPGRLKKSTGAAKPASVQMVTELFGCMLDISQIKQEQLYIQGIKDGIRIRKLVKEIEEGEEC